MNELIKQYLCCPICKSDLIVSDTEIVCTSCKRLFKIKNGIPLLIDLDSLEPHLKGQIEYFEKEDITSTENYNIAPWQRSYIQRFKDNFKDENYGVIVDTGTGSGYIPLEFANRCDLIIATDLTLKSLVRLQHILKSINLENKVLLVCCDTQKLPIKTGIADYYVSNAVFEHLPNEASAIAEMNRVTKKNAGIVVTVPLRMKYINPLFYLVNMIHDKNIGHLRRYSEYDFETRFNNYRAIKFYYTGHTAKVFKTLVNRFLKNMFDEQTIEDDDQKISHKKWFASNIGAFLRKSS